MKKPKHTASACSKRNIESGMMEIRKERSLGSISLALRKRTKTNISIKCKCDAHLNFQQRYEMYGLCSFS